MAELEAGRYRRSERGSWVIWADSSAWKEEWWPVVERSLANPAEALRESRHARTFMLSLPHENGPQTSFLKIYHRSGWRADLKDRWRQSKAMRALRISRRLVDDGFLAPAVIAAGEQRTGRLLQRAFLLTEAVAWPTLAQLGELLASLPGEEGRRRRRVVIGALGAEVGRLHRAGYVHGDLVVTNVLVDEGPPPRFCFLDHDRSRKRSKPSNRELRRTLVELNRLAVPGVRHADRLRFLVRYADVHAWSRSEMRRQARWVTRKTRALLWARAVAAATTEQTEVGE
jgi:tRNA A-37 threonylcarbamoyl transferase component Bud32